MSKEQNSKPALAQLPEESTGLLAEIKTNPELAAMYKEDLDDSMHDVIPRLPQYSIIRETAQFETPEEETTKELCGVIVDSHLSFAHWPEGDEKMPDCYSFDGKLPDPSVQNPIHSKCISCPKNQWGSAKEGRGKECKNMRRIVILIEGESFPSRLTLPPTSLASYDEYASLLRTKNLPVNAVVTVISLEKITTTEGYKVAKAKFSSERILTRDEYLTIRKFKDIVIERRSEEIVGEEYSTESATPDIEVEGGDEETPF